MAEEPLTAEELREVSTPEEIEAVWQEALAVPLPAYDLTSARARRGSPVLG
jgi:hypothetical protein